MNLKYSYIPIFILFFLFQNAYGAETIFLYKGTFNRKLEIEELYNFKKTKVASPKLKNLIKITNQKEDKLYNILSYEIELPLTTSSKLMNSKIGEIFLSRISTIIYPNKIFNKDISIKAIRSGIILSSYKNNQKVNLIDFFKLYSLNLSLKKKK